MKKTLLLTILILSSFCVYAQETEEIELPDVTTVIKGESIKAGLDSLPDFNDVLQEQQGSGEIVPIMPEVEINNTDENITENSTIENKSIYAEGQLGGGFPNLFKGDFSVYRLDGESPFSLTFHHNSSAGYSRHSLNDGYNDRDTSIGIEKEIIKNNFDFNFGGLYETAGQGFQNKVSNISDYDFNVINAFGKFEWTLPKNFLLGAKLDSNFYNRYADITSAINFDCPQSIKKMTAFDIIPSIFANWNNNCFDIVFDGDFWFGGLSSISSKVYQRGNLGLGLSWANEFVDIFGNVGLIFGNSVDGESVVVPFNLGVGTEIPVSFSNRKVALKFEGGLDSYQNSVCSLEKEYKYSNFTFMPYESSEWFGKINLDLPLKSSFTGNMAVNFRKTAFDNGRYQPDYSLTSLNYGMYGYSLKNMTILSTEFNVAYHYKLLSLTAGWCSNWIDIPVLESAQMITLNFSVQSEESKWGINLFGKVCLGDSIPMPIINIDSFVRVTTDVRIVIGAEDIIELLTGKTRSYAGQYIAQGANASLLVKFFF